MTDKIIRFPWKLLPVLMIAYLGLLLGCGTGGLTDATTPVATSAASTAGGSGSGTGTDNGTGTTGGGAAQTATQLKVTASPVSIKSGNVDTSTITATVLDANNAAVKNLIVVFSASGGQINDASAITDATGKAQITFSSGTIDPSNRVATITGTVAGVSPSLVPVTITGSTLTLSTDKSNITNDGSVTSKLTVTAKDAAGTAVFDVPVTISISGSTGGGGVSLAAAAGYTAAAGSTATDLRGNTDALGQFSAVVAGTAAGPVTVVAQGLGNTATQAYNVSSLAAVFGFTAPVANPHAITTGAPLTVTVNAPPGVTTVRFATTLGGFDPGAVPVLDVAGTGSVSATFSSNLAGVATIQASDFNNPSTTATLGVVISAPAAAAAQLTLQPSVSSVRPSTGELQNTSKITATVKTSGLQIVGGAPVAFTITNPTGGGETISPVIVFTDGTGTATTTFTSGTLPSDANGVLVQATVLGVGPPAVSATTKIVIGGTPGSVVIGQGSKIVVNADSTTYNLPMVVQVTDSNGNAVPGSIVSLSVWPTRYSSGFWYDKDPDPEKEKFAPYVTGTFGNEDLNENMFKDAGEDVNRNGILDPPNSAAGAVPATVKTDENGLGNFFITYPKQSAVWIRDRLRASVVVSGTETTSFVTFSLPFEKVEGESGILPPSNYNIELTVATGGTITYNLPFFNSSLAGTTYTTALSPLSSIPLAGGTYSFTAPAGVASGTVFNDVITVQDGFLGTIRVPVIIVIQ